MMWPALRDGSNRVEILVSPYAAYMGDSVDDRYYSTYHTWYDAYTELLLLQTIGQLDEM